jgi:hypothetical protein
VADRAAKQSGADGGDLERWQRERDRVEFDPFAHLIGNYVLVLGLATHFSGRLMGVSRAVVNRWVFSELAIVNDWQDSGPTEGSAEVPNVTAENPAVFMENSAMAVFLVPWGQDKGLGC